jgi:6-pyruvoyltetrahydropterin/6-carboxytetrahydropterin synthase
MSPKFHVRVTKDSLTFSAAHFITFNGNVCERLHGHNYGVAAEAAGPLDENHYVVDFIALRDSLRAIVAQLDHHVLLPTQHPQIHVVAGEREVEARFEDRRWVFPRGDCVLLPLANTTAERLAEYIARQLLAALRQRTKSPIERLSVAVDECQGQWGVCELGAESAGGNENAGQQGRA